MKNFVSIDSFLKKGAILSLSRDLFVLGWGELSANASCQGAGFFKQNFDLSESRPWRVFSNYSYLSKDELREFMERVPIQPGQNKRQWSSAIFSEFENKFIRIQDHIQMGKISKAVPVTYESSEGCLTSFEISHFITRALKTSDSNYLYGYWDDEGGVLGLTPEVLFRKNGKNLFSMALAGTKESHCSASLLNDEKEIFEHRLVVEEMDKALMDLGQNTWGKTEEQCVGSLTHLKTEVNCILQSEFSFDQIVAQLHPTPALGVFPKKSNLNWFLTEVSDSARGIFGAPFGFQSNLSEGFCIVAIRNLYWDGRQTKLYSGCGIVEKSQIKKEWKELEVKRNSVKQMLGL